MQEILHALVDFHQAFEVPWRTTPTAQLDPSEYQLRHELLREESEEYLQACQAQDLVAIADALGDQLYVLCGTIIAHGMQYKIEAVIQEIHRSNMSKLGPDGKPIRRADGKVLKSEGYFRPNLKPILQNQD
jgi:predicted HAD superfamily Cof-like phosphohydrolase